MPNAARHGVLLVAALLLALPSGCKKDAPSEKAAGAASAGKAKRRPPVDRLAKDEMAPGDTVVWGFSVPRGMKLEAQFRDAAHIGGKMPFDALVEYVGKQIAPQHAEIAPRRALFPRARILAGAVDRVYDIEVNQRRRRTHIVIRDITPPPTVDGLTESERWQRLGLTETGDPIDPKELR